MPIIDGKRVLSRYTSLKLDELSSVDRPAQEGARALIMKRADDSNSPPVNKGNANMTDLEKAQAEIADLTAKLAKCESDMAALQAAADEEAKEGESAKLRAELADTKKALAAATDESVTVGGESFSKSEVGDASFRAMKAMATERDTARFEKRASEEFPLVVGSTAEKALVLAAVEKMDDATKAATMAILTAHQKMVAGGFDRIGTQYAGAPTVTAKAAAATFEGKVTEIAKRDGITQTAAMQKARGEFPEEFKAAYPDQAAN